MRALSAERFLPGESDRIEFRPIELLRESCRRSVTYREALSISGDPVAIRYPHAGCRAVPGKDHIVCKIDPAKVRQFPVGRFDNGDVLELELLFDVGDPTFAERFPGQHRHRTRA